MNNQVKTFLKYVFWAFVLTVFCPIALFFLYAYMLGMGHHYGNEYRLMWSGRMEDWYIQKNESIIIKPTVADSQKITDHVIGWRYPVQYFDCDGGYKMKLVERREYFILSLSDGSTYNFVKKDKFDEKLIDLGLYEKSDLNYSIYEERWQEFFASYKKDDWSDCKEISFR